MFTQTSEKIRLGISDELSTRQIVHMKCQVLFSLKKKKKYCMLHFLHGASIADVYFSTHCYSL